jgi:hypothetical protein
MPDRSVLTRALWQISESAPLEAIGFGNSYAIILWKKFEELVRKSIAGTSSVERDFQSYFDDRS